ncbi:Uracil phosphoribosyltransferase [Mycena kentingensis (nom. inval.)]|nr:Uracil phosphoribosyltransferase [Mycena kentingensis (nom. inval.)]
MSRNLSLTDTSPMLVYTDDWQTYFSGSGYNTQDGQLGQGSSVHLTSRNGAQISLDFFGNAIFLYGNGTYDVSLDDVVASTGAKNGLLFAKDGLAEKNHSVTLTARMDGAQTFGFAAAIIGCASSVVDERAFDDADPFFSYSPNWITFSAPGVPNATTTLPFHQTTVSGASVAFTFSDASTVAVHGTLNSGHGRYSVALDGDTAKVLSGDGRWLVPDTVVFFQTGLDPTQKHSINITNLDDDKKFVLSSVVLNPVASSFEDEPASTASSSVHTPTAVGSEQFEQRRPERGVIIGASVGGVVGLALFATLGMVVTAKQLGRTLNKYFKDHPSVTIIRIDYNDVKNEVCWELPDGTASGEVGGEGIFPHIYGRCMHKSDIESVAVWDRQDGAWDAALESGAAWLVY